MSLFDVVSAEYDETRPRYPAELYDAVERVAGGLDGRRVLDVAAGTGIATRELTRRGAEVVAVDLGPDMLARLAARASPALAAVARAEALPLRPATVDLAVCATAWHWLDGTATARELHRVVRPGGAVAVWWGNNQVSDDIAWERDQAALYEEYGLRRPEAAERPEAAAEEAAARLAEAGFTATQVRTFHWEREVPVELHLRQLATHSVVIRLGARGGELLDHVRVALARYGPSVTERFVGVLALARR